jgi:hypothetical protein
MPVVDIRRVRVVMIQRLMDMGVRVVLVFFFLMVMLVVFFRMMVKMFMLDQDMVVKMGMFVGRKNQGTGNHETECDRYLQVRILNKQNE